MIDISNYNFPSSCGVYIFKDICGLILYIGKAKNLKKRVLSYFTDRQIDWKIKYLLSRAESVEWILLSAEGEALLLEADLISTHKPMFNKLLKSDSPFLYVIIERIHEKNLLPKIFISRIFKKTKNNIIYGPFIDRKNLYKAIDTLKLFFNLNICNKKIRSGCLSYFLGKCSGSCRLDFDQNEYIKRHNLAVLALINDQNEFINKIDLYILEAKSNFEFEIMDRFIKYKQSYINIIDSLNKLIEPREYDIEKIIYDISIKEDFVKNGLLELESMENINKKISIIDCIDISHLQGNMATGSCIRYIDGFFSKKESKSYYLNTNINNDYENIKTLLKMHYNKNYKFKYPDLIMIDGGKGQLSAAKEIINDIIVIALAKKKECLYLNNKDIFLILDPKKPIGALLIKIRNSAHNAAIWLHRKLIKSNLNK